MKDKLYKFLRHKHELYTFLPSIYFTSHNFVTNEVLLVLFSLYFLIIQHKSIKSRNYDLAFVCVQRPTKQNPSIDRQPKD